MRSPADPDTTVPGNDQLVAVVLGAAIAGGAVKAILSALLNSGDSTSWLSLVNNIVFYPFVIPAVLVGVYLRVLISAIINFGAEVFFVAVLLGYAWSRTREQFMRL